MSEASAYGNVGDWIQLNRVHPSNLRDGLFKAAMHGLLELGYSRKRKVGVYKMRANTDPRRVYVQIGGLSRKQLHKLARAGLTAASLLTVDEWSYTVLP